MYSSHQNFFLQVQKAMTNHQINIKQLYQPCIQIGIAGPIPLVFLRSIDGPAVANLEIEATTTTGQDFYDMDNVPNKGHVIRSHLENFLACGNDDDNVGNNGMLAFIQNCVAFLNTMVCRITSACPTEPPPAMMAFVLS